VAVDPARKQPGIRLRHRLLGVELALGVAVVAAVVVQQASALFDPFDELVGAADPDPFAGPEPGPQQRRRTQGVHAHHPAAGEDDLHLAPGEAKHRAQAQLGFGTGEPALARCEGVAHRQSATCSRAGRNIAARPRQPWAWPKAGRLASGPFTRQRAGAWLAPAWALARATASSWRGHSAAQPVKKAWAAAWSAGPLAFSASQASSRPAR